MSADGTGVLAVADNALLFYSGDGGVSWSSRTLDNGDGNANPWAATAMAGSLQMAAKRGGYLWNTVGANVSGWSSSAADISSSSVQQNWSALAMADPGTVHLVAAAVTGGGIYTSAYDASAATFGGAGLTEVAASTTGSQDWKGVVVTRTGALAAVAANSPGGIYHSNDGRIWAPPMRWAVCRALPTSAPACSHGLESSGCLCSLWLAVYHALHTVPTCPALAHAAPCTLCCPGCACAEGSACRRMP